MRTKLRIALVGDYDEAMAAHRAIPLALRAAADSLSLEVEPVWLATDAIADPFDPKGFDGIWCTPGSPYRSMAGALRAIRVARERRLPFLGTCGGFQHALIEYARDVLRWADAEHAESSPDAARAVISPLACGLLENRSNIRLRPGSRVAAAYGAAAGSAHGIEEAYQCRYGLNPAFRSQLIAGPLRIGATDLNGEIRAIELISHPFFVATLFQPERAALEGRPAPLVRAFLQACAA